MAKLMCNGISHIIGIGTRLNNHNRVAVNRPANVTWSFCPAIIGNSYLNAFACPEDIIQLCLPILLSRGTLGFG